MPEADKGRCNMPEVLISGRLKFRRSSFQKIIWELFRAKMLITDHRK